MLQKATKTKQKIQKTGRFPVFFVADSKSERWTTFFPNPQKTNTILLFDVNLRYFFENSVKNLQKKFKLFLKTPYTTPFLYGIITATKL